MIKQFDEFINEANRKVEENAWRELILFTDNVQPIYSYLWSFVETLVSRGEKDNKQIESKLTKDTYYVNELKHIISLVEDENEQGVKKGQTNGLENFNSLPGKDKLKLLADHIADELEDYDNGK